jgi:HD-like signal output (HDOD) protein
MTNTVDDSEEMSLQNIFNEIDAIAQSNSNDYMSAIIAYCEKNDIEIESIAKYIKNNVVLKAKLQEEAEELNYLDKIPRLPL